MRWKWNVPRRGGRRTAFLLILLAMIGVGIPLARSESVKHSQTGQSLTNRSVPMAWCFVKGSPAEAAPNVPRGGGFIDTDTDSVGWRRHERPSDHTLIPKAQITLRSAILHTGSALKYPIINDPDTTNGHPGDVTGWDVNVDAFEFTSLINSCDAAYANINHADIGITAVNVGLFHENLPGGSWNYVPIVGWGGCNQVVANPGVCATPYDGRIMVIDNHYLFHAIADRSLPPSPLDPNGNFVFALADLYDQAVGNAVGYALGLPPRSTAANPHPLLEKQQLDTDPIDERTDNFDLNAGEVAALNANAADVPGAETEKLLTNFGAARFVDRKDPLLARPHFDLASLRLVLDIKGKKVFGAEQLAGKLPCTSPALPPTTFVFLGDLDNKKATGMKPAALKKLGLPTAFSGADLVAKTVVSASKPKSRKQKSSDAANCKTAVSAWGNSGGAPKPLPSSAYTAQIQTLRMYPNYNRIPGATFRSPPTSVDVFDTIVFRFNNSSLGSPVKLKKPVRLQAFVLAEGKTLDQLGKPGEGGKFVLEQARFPKCSAPSGTKIGGKATVAFTGLLPKREVYVMLGTAELAETKTDAKGGGRATFKIPKNIRPGGHLISIGHEKISLTADCILKVAA